MTAIKFVTPPTDEFRRVLKARVDSYFADRGLSKHWNAVMALKLALYLGGYLGAYALIMLGGFSVPSVRLASSSLAGRASLQIGHDACHGLSGISRVNDWGHAFTASAPTPTTADSHTSSSRLTNIPFATRPAPVAIYDSRRRKQTAYHRSNRLCDPALFRWPPWSDLYKSF